MTKLEEITAAIDLPIEIDGLPHGLLLSEAFRAKIVVAMLTAMREPSEAMVMAMARVTEPEKDGEIFETAEWRAAIDAILNEQSPPASEGAEGR